MLVGAGLALDTDAGNGLAGSDVTEAQKCPCPSVARCRAGVGRLLSRQGRCRTTPQRGATRADLNS